MSVSRSGGISVIAYKSVNNYCTPSEHHFIGSCLAAGLSVDSTQTGYRRDYWNDCRLLANSNRYRNPSRVFLFHTGELLRYHGVSLHGRTLDNRTPLWVALGELRCVLILRGETRTQCLLRASIQGERREATPRFD